MNTNLNSFIIDLCGKWTLSGINERKEAIEIDATVPGCVHTDLIKAGIISDIYYRDNSRNIQWIENEDFTYKKKFLVSELHSNAFLEADGLDTYCDVYLNGKHVLSADNMFTPYELSVDGILKVGENELELRFRSPVREVADRPNRSGAFTTERLHTRRIQCTYGWDWVDRFVTMGIYRPIRIAFRQRNEIESVYAYTETITPFAAQLKLEIALRDLRVCDDKIHIEIRDPNGNTVFSKDRVILRERICEFIDIKEPQLWYPVGYGSQPLYTLDISTPTSAKQEKIGIRTITVHQIEDAANSDYKDICRELQSVDFISERDHNESTASFFLAVNGTKIMCKGANWVPCEPFPSEEDTEKIERLLTLSVDAGVNMVRVWGGGIFERDEFYECCDRLGLLVCQDFLMACGNYPEEEEWFISALQREAAAAVPRLRNHACLAFWSGDNENAERGDENRTDFLGYRSATYGIEPTVNALDPNRRFFPSSPYGGNTYSSVTRGTTHITNYLWPIFCYIADSDMRDYRDFFSLFLSRFCVEQPAFGMSFTSCLKKFLTDEDIFGESTDMLEYHMKNNPYLKHSLFETSEFMAEKIFGKFTNGADRILKMQMLHCEWTRISFELYRRYKGFSNGLLYWMLNDCWPASSGWSFIDYYASPKPAYYTFKRCAKEIISVISVEKDILKLHISNDSQKECRCTARLYVYDTESGKESDISLITLDIPADQTQKVFECPYGSVKENMSDSCVMLCDLESEADTDRAMLIPTRLSDVGAIYDGYRITDENETSVTVEADSFTPFVMLDLPYLLSDNCFSLKAGEKKTVRKLKKL